jgi:hypothetical protein
MSWLEAQNVTTTCTDAALQSSVGLNCADALRPGMGIDANDLARDREVLAGHRLHGDRTEYVRGQETRCPTPKLILEAALFRNSRPFSSVAAAFSLRFEPVHVLGSPEGTHLDHLSLIVEAKGIDDLDPFFTGRIE